MARTTRSTGGIIDKTKIPEAFIDHSLIPDDGMAIYASGMAKPYYLRIKKEMIIGRKIQETSESFLDLSAMDGFNLGLSRRHALIQRAGAGYEVLDLASTNGTWVNDNKLSPNKPYPLLSGSQLRLGRLKLLVIYHPATKPPRNE